MSQHTSIKLAAYKLVFWQLAAVTGLALILFLLQGMKSGVSTLLGGLSYGLPNLFFVWRVFVYMGARAAKKFLIAFLAGEFAKLTLSAVLFVLMAKFLPVSVIFMMIGFVGAIVAFWIASFYFLSHDQEVLG